ncbi:hypothetical protein BAY61_05160 [Prauserella marina]|uniref:Uncharacterized protein n=1 Tax=Prauserella marina TaxID=530584 RepID=A0A222VKL1_9PSEU|nr:hypothetical protein [Prauserella marina]ASR34479.1 hypothetical protein BAY61_05160 [Prauserella marina]PWV85926.1 hypothetical protein DES30_1011956 [Prauserella marina]SDC42167.1 hypothetical protein SAMN05421630_10236 [Prauserella marina]
MSDVRIKHDADDENEVHDVATFADQARNVVTPVLRLPEDAALAVVTAFAGIVRAAKRSTAATTRDRDGIVRSQVFEEGDVYMLESPFDGFFADRYVMDFYNVTERGVCSRMHLHTGLRFVRMMTGPDTRIRVSSLSPFEVTDIPGVTPFVPEAFDDELPGAPEGVRRTRHNLVVPPCSFVDMQIPRGVSHQFNAIGEHAVIDSVHPEESVETFRERMSGYRMMAQTVFLADELPPSDSCDLRA